MGIFLVTTTLSVLLLYGFAQEYVRLRLTPHLANPNLSDVPGRPLVSILIPARNEEHTIARCLDGILNQTYGTYEIIVVDDNSTDATPDILAHYATKQATMRVVAGTPLPPSWAGKCHACQQAAAVAQGEWLLFLDADTMPQPELVAALLTHAYRWQLDMVTVFAFMELGSFWERIILPPFGALLNTIFPFERINAPDAQPEEIIANGQCIFVRRTAYEMIGGHSAVANEVIEDVMLARALKQAGFRIGALQGQPHVIRVRMYTNGREVVEGLTKNAVAGYNSGGSRSVWGGMRMFALTLLPWCLLAWGFVLLIIYGTIQAWAVTVHGMVVTCISMLFWSIFLRQRYALPWYYAILWPFGLLCYGAITIRSLWKILSGRGVIWKGRTYAGI